MSSSTPEEHTPAYRVVFYTYHVKIAQMFLTNQDVIDEFGYPTSGDSEVDYSLAQSREDAVLSLLTMARLYQQGASIEFVDHAKLPAMYQTVNDLLKRWEAIANHPIKSAQYDIPVDDLQDLDLFAAGIYELAKPYMTRKTSSGLSEGLARLSDRLLVKRHTGAATQTSAKDDSHHESVVPYIRHNQAARDNVPSNVQRKNRSAYQIMEDGDITTDHEKI